MRLPQIALGAVIGSLFAAFVAVLVVVATPAESSDDYCAGELGKVTDASGESAEVCWVDAGQPMEEVK